MKEFISEARKKAKEFGVSRLCKFEVNDIRERIKVLAKFDIIILGAIGPVFGDYLKTLALLSKHLKKNGLIIIDDGYAENNRRYLHPLIKKRKKILEQIKKAGMRLIDEKIFDKKEIRESDAVIFKDLKKRCRELMKKHPEKNRLFEKYVKQQKKGNDVLETKIICSTMVIKK
jgi:protein-L-isoaspartate O-methyltransferase